MAGRSSRAQAVSALPPVADPKRPDATPRLPDGRLTRARKGGAWVEGAFWLAAVGLLSPLAIYYRAGVMPLPALFGIAGGIALGLALSGRRLHQSLLDDALAGRAGRGRFLMTFGMALLLLFFVLLGSVVALILILRQGAPALPV